MANMNGLFRIGRDAELRYSASGNAVCNLSLAYNYYDKNAEKNRSSQWIDAVMFGKRAESMAQYLTKGSQVSVLIGDPHIETYQKKDGSDGFKLVGNVLEIELVSNRAAESGSTAEPAPRQQSKPEGKPQSKPSFDDLSDDIPF